ncbi:MAG: hypothetical protein RIQ79_2400, partial [Verrucomicrobiota bacterium]
LVGGAACAAEPTVLKYAAFAHHAEKYNTMEPEAVVNLVSNADAAAWLERNVPLFECPDPQVEETYWFRWWALSKQLRRDAGSGRFVFGEFINRPRPVSSALGHHLMEGRWLRDQQYHDDYVRYWFHGGKDGGPAERFHRYSQWVQHALWSRWLVTQDTATLTGQLDELVADYGKWETERMRPDGLYWQHDVWDAMEESISGGRKVMNVRPTINAYMYGNATALAAIARLAGREELAKQFDAKAANLRRLVQETLWNKEAGFFGAVTDQLAPIAVREEIGFIPWYFHLPEAGRGYEAAWRQLTDETGFKAPFGITTAERRAPSFRTRGTGTCEWDGAVWPFATAQTLTALGNVLRDYPQDAVSNRDYFDAFLTYSRSQRYDGLPYIGEYLDEKTGAWLKGRDPRSYYYNHSTYADLVITGVVGLRPRADKVIEVVPLLPAGTWDWFALDGVRYHGHELAIIWDRDGTRYKHGAGLMVFVDGKIVARSERLEHIEGLLP